MEFLPTIVGWLTFSAILSLMALGVTLLYRTTKVANFAHASFVTVAAYVTYTSTVILSPNPYLGVPIAFILVGLLGLLLFYAVLEPMRRRNSSTVMLMIATLAFDIIMLGVTNIHADYLNTVYKVPSRNVLLSGLDFKFMGRTGNTFRGTWNVSPLLGCNVPAVEFYYVGHSVEGVDGKPFSFGSNRHQC